MTIYIDLDGTILDISQKYINLFADLSGSSYELALEFWAERKLGKSTEQVLGHLKYGKINPQTFADNWIELIETREYLAYDMIFPGLLEMFELIHQTHELVICTARQSQDLLIEQLEDLKILNYFQDVLVTEKKVSKLTLMSNHRKTLKSSDYEQDWIVGDTPEDITTGTQINIKSCAVLSGLTPQHKFESLEVPPTDIKDSLLIFLGTLKN
jgi:phosphoglycolate phosphatase